ncbi:hypothetical protein B0H10DRAFT_2237849 [Mycena sp. CBHHK59/15]|nr:hypothetical protein B0H10DRAFT_2237849 [Mycena sp. CBHHK59/15]
MATNVGAASRHTLADRESIGSLSPLTLIPLTLIEFRNYTCGPRGIFSSTYITRNATKFLDYEWVDISDLREYMQQTTPGSGLGTSATRLSTASDPVRVKIEPTPLLVTLGPPVSVKAEP